MLQCSLRVQRQVNSLRNSNSCRLYAKKKVLPGIQGKAPDMQAKLSKLSKRQKAMRTLLQSEFAKRPKEPEPYRALSEEERSRKEQKAKELEETIKRVVASNRDVTDVLHDYLKELHEHKIKLDAAKKQSKPPVEPQSTAGLKAVTQGRSKILPSDPNLRPPPPTLAPKGDKRPQQQQQPQHQPKNAPVKTFPELIAEVGPVPKPPPELQIFHDEELPNAIYDQPEGEDNDPDQEEMLARELDYYKNVADYDMQERRKQEMESQETSFAPKGAPNIPPDQLPPVDTTNFTPEQQQMYQLAKSLGYIPGNVNDIMSKEVTEKLKPEPKKITAEVEQFDSYIKELEELERKENEQLIKWDNQQREEQLAKEASNKALTQKLLKEEGFNVQSLEVQFKPPPNPIELIENDFKFSPRFMDILDKSEYKEPTAEDKAAIEKELSNHKFVSDEEKNKHYKQTGGQVLPWEQLLNHRRIEGKKFVREYIHLEDIPNTQGKFSVLTYNILADSISSSTDLAQVDTFRIVKRLVAVLDELRQYNADILCLQEVEKQAFTDFFEPQLNAMGYVGELSINTKNSNKPNQIWINNRHYGDAVFWKTSKFAKRRFEIHQYRNIFSKVNRGKIVFAPALINELLQIPSVFTVSELIIKGAKEHHKSLLLINTHLPARRAPPVGIAQIHSALQMVEQQASKNALCPNPPIIFCGDFNVNPGAALYNFILEGSLSNNDPVLQLEGGPAIVSNSSTKSKQIEHSFKFGSAYGSTIGEYQQTLDYIWYSKDSLKPVMLLKPNPNFATLKDQYPSDHQALLSEFVLTSPITQSSTPNATTTATATNTTTPAPKSQTQTEQKKPRGRPKAPEPEIQAQQTEVKPTRKRKEKS